MSITYVKYNQDKNGINKISKKPGKMKQFKKFSYYFKGGGEFQ